MNSGRTRSSGRSPARKLTRNRSASSVDIRGMGCSIGMFSPANAGVPRTGAPAVRTVRRLARRSSVRACPRCAERPVHRCTSRAASCAAGRSNASVSPWRFVGRRLRDSPLKFNGRIHIARTSRRCGAGSSPLLERGRARRRCRCIGARRLQRATTTRGCSPCMRASTPNRTALAVLRAARATRRRRARSPPWSDARTCAA